MNYGVMWESWGYCRQGRKGRHTKVQKGFKSKGFKPIEKQASFFPLMVEQYAYK